MPVMLGVLAGSVLGARILPVAQSRQLRLLFALALMAVAAGMIYRGATGHI
jgi:uncharacterized membrane protein YfcA